MATGARSGGEAEGGARRGGTAGRGSSVSNEWTAERK